MTDADDGGIYDRSVLPKLLLNLRSGREKIRSCQKYEISTETRDGDKVVKFSHVIGPAKLN